MDALIAELEAATEGSRKLDCDIQEQDFRTGSINRVRYVNGKGPFWLNKFNDNWFEVGHYTTAFEAALTWMPEGCVIELCQSCPARTDDTWWDAYVFERPRTHDSEPIGESKQGIPTPAMAACIAIAKAHRAMDTA